MTRSSSARADRACARRWACAESGPEDRVHHQGVPDAQPHRRRAGRHRRVARQQWARITGPGTCTTPSRARTGSATRTRSNIWCREAPAAVYELEHAGVPFSRTDDGTIYQRPFGGHDAEHGRGPARAAHLRRRRPHRPRDAPRALPAEPEVRRRLLHRIFRARPDHGGRRVPRRDRAVHGGRQRSTASAATQTVLATGGYGRCYFSATSAHTCTGDGGGDGAARRACRCRTWSSSSSTRPASTARAC